MKWWTQSGLSSCRAQILHRYPAKQTSLRLSAASHVQRASRPLTLPGRRTSLAVRGLLTTKASTHDTPRPQAAVPPAPHERPSMRPLPKVESNWPTFLVVGFVGVIGWIVFFEYVTNNEKVTSSVLQQIMRAVREDETLANALGEALRPEPAWYLNGAPKINGRINHLQGSVDLSFRIKGTQGAGTLYFTSVRKEKGEPFTIIRFKVVADDGNVFIITPQKRIDMVQ